jgi:hypothetical protein
MHLRRIACFVLGAWIVGSVFAIYITAQSGSATDPVMQLPPPEVNKMIQTLGADQTRMLLHYHGAEQTRLYIAAWGRLQFLLGFFALLLLAASTRSNRLTLALCGAMLVFAAFSHLVLVPEINYLARGLNFASGWSANRARYLALRGTFTALEVLKLSLGCLLAGYLFVYKRRRPSVAADEDEHAAGHIQTAGAVKNQL